MPCSIHMHGRPELNNPVLIEGLPGIGFVANIAALHLIAELRAKLFAEITSSSFQDLSVALENGKTLSPINKLYYFRASKNERDLIIWHGNTQGLTTFGQYELCGSVLDIAKDLGCEYVITLGGFRHELAKNQRQTYCAASNSEVLKEALSLGAKIMVGQIYGLAGVTVGLAKLRNLKGFALLVETPGTVPDAEAALEALRNLSNFLGMKIDLSRVSDAAEETKSMLESFGLMSRRVKEEKTVEETDFRWFV